MPSTLQQTIRELEVDIPIAQWFVLLEHRRQEIALCLDKFTLSELGSFKGMHGGKGYTADNHSLQDDKPVCESPEGLALSTQGVFFSTYDDRIRYISEKSPSSSRSSWCWNFRDGTSYVWGLTRNNKLLLATIDFEGTTVVMNYRYHRAKTVHVAYSAWEEISAAIRQHPREMWDQLGGAVLLWAEARRKIHEVAEQLSVRMQQEKALSEVIPFSWTIPS